MTTTTNADLITWLRREHTNELSPLGCDYTPEEIASALEAAEQRAEEAERERDRLDEAFDRDLPWRYDEVEAQRNQLAAVVEKVRAECTRVPLVGSGYHFPDGDKLRAILASTPANDERNGSDAS